MHILIKFTLTFKNNAPFRSCISKIKNTLVDNAEDRDTGVSVKFLMVGETNSMVGCHLKAEGHSVQLGVWGAL